MKLEITFKSGAVFTAATGKDRQTYKDAQIREFYADICQAGTQSGKHLRAITKRPYNAQGLEQITTDLFQNYAPVFKDAYVYAALSTVFANGFLNGYFSGGERHV